MLEEEDDMMAEEEDMLEEEDDMMAEEEDDMMAEEEDDMMAEEEDMLEEEDDMMAEDTSLKLNCDLDDLNFKKMISNTFKLPEGITENINEFKRKYSNEEKFGNKLTKRLKRKKKVKERFSNFDVSELTEADNKHRNFRERLNNAKRNRR